MWRLVVLFIIFAVLPAQAYIDPGVGSSLFQAAYALVFGSVMAWVLRPWSLLRAWWEKVRAVTVKPLSATSSDNASQG